jgi:hypothetical protein
MSDSVWLLGAVRVTARYRAPTDDGGLLVDPPLTEIGALLDHNARLLAAAPVRLGDVPLSEFRRLAVAEIVEAARYYLAESGEPVPPAFDHLLVAGHQPEFFHPGVWIKNFVLASQARQHGRAALNLVVDNDTAKAMAVRVPVVADEPGDVAIDEVPFDRAEGDWPYEEGRLVDRGLFDSFPERLTKLTRPWAYEPLAVPTWPVLHAEIDRGATIGEASSRARRFWERKWGVTNLELPVSRLAGTRAFAGFVQTLLVDLPRFVDNYNAAIRAYREANDLRSRNHPAPELAIKGEWIEAPFWAWRIDAPKRVKLFARRVESALELRAGERTMGNVPTDSAAFLRAWSSLMGDGWKVRPRALTLTLFSRLAVADGFIHGIGGGKYDEVTDDIMRRHFGIDPPRYGVVSATIRLPIRRFSATPQSLHEAERNLRDLEWNPQRFPEPVQELPELVFEKTRLIEDEPVDKIDRRGWFRQLQRVTRDLRPAVADRRQRAEADVLRFRTELAANGILASREFSWLLFPEAVLRNAFSRQN